MNFVHKQKKKRMKNIDIGLVYLSQTTKINIIILQKNSQFSLSESNSTSFFFTLTFLLLNLLLTTVIIIIAIEIIKIASTLSKN